MSLERLDRWLAAAPAVDLAELPTNRGEWRPELRIVVVGCGEAKRSVRSQAQDLYTGPLTRDAISYAHSSGAIWAIVSGRHGLIWPEVEIDPYDQRIPSGEGLQGWTDRIGSQLSLWVDHLGWRPAIRREGDRYATLPARIVLEVHAGSEYVAGLSGRWWGVEAPLRGLSMLERRRWYREAREAGAPQLSMFGGSNG